MLLYTSRIGLTCYRTVRATCTCNLPTISVSISILISGLDKNQYLTVNSSLPFGQMALQLSLTWRYFELSKVQSRVKRAMDVSDNSCPSGKWLLKSACPTGKFTWHRLSDTTLVEPWIWSRLGQVNTVFAGSIHVDIKVVLFKLGLENILSCETHLCDAFPSQWPWN